MVINLSQNQEERDIIWEGHTPPLNSPLQNWETWLKEVFLLRGRTLHETGRRPEFSHWWDADERDPYAYHLLARTSERLVGCVRFMPLNGSIKPLTEELIGSENFQKALSVLRINPVECAEPSRWIVAPEFAGLGIGQRLVAGGWVLAQRLGFRHLLGLAGTRDHQDQILMKIGGQTVPGFNLFPRPELDDELRLLHFNLEQPSPAFLPFLAEMAGLLPFPNPELSKAD